MYITAAPDQQQQQQQQQAQSAQQTQGGDTELSQAADQQGQ